MHHARLLHLISSAALLLGLSACKTTSPKPAADRSTTEEATQEAEKQEAKPKLVPVISFELQQDGVEEQYFADVEEVFRWNIVDVGYCHEQALEEHSEAGGVLAVEFDISPDGRVEDLKTDAAELAYPEMADCVRGRVKEWVFPEPAGGESTHISVAYSFKLRAQTEVVTGSLDRDLIREVIQKHRSEIKDCYEKERRQGENLEGTVVMNWTIGESGNVTAAKTKRTTLNSRDLESCMAAAIRQWVFPEPKGGGIVVVNYPFSFSAND